jgi:hypothetical protein
MQCAGCKYLLIYANGEFVEIKEEVQAISAVDKFAVNLTS